MILFLLLNLVDNVDVDTINGEQPANTFVRTNCQDQRRLSPLNKDALIKEKYYFVHDKDAYECSRRTYRILVIHIRCSGCPQHFIKFIQSALVLILVWKIPWSIMSFDHTGVFSNQRADFLGRRVLFTVRSSKLIWSYR